MPTRLTSVDLMRGLTMAAMIVVNNPGSWAHMAPGLRHAPWGHWPTPADLVFPFFLVLVGVSTPLALARRTVDGTGKRPLLGRALRRALALAAIGVFLNLFPAFDLATVRLPGVLQRIALVALACAAVWLVGGRRAAIYWCVGLLVGYTLLLRLAPVPGQGGPVLTPDAHLPAWLDDRVFGAHTWRGPGDPEGVLSSLGAVATGLLGVWAGAVLMDTPAVSGRARQLAAAGLVALAAGVGATLVVPLAKDVWSPAYALVTGGAALLVLGGLHEVVDGRPAPGAAGPLAIMGRQALPAYILAHLLSDLFIQVLRWTDADGVTRSLHTVVHGKLLASWLPPVVASAAYSFLMLVLVWALVALADRRGWRLRV